MLAIGSDHAGYALKCEVKKFLDELKVEYIDCGCDGERADYPDIAEKTCAKITSGECEKGILICGTGIGIIRLSTHVCTMTQMFCAWAAGS